MKTGTKFLPRKAHHGSIEPLEARIAPAGIVRSAAGADVNAIAAAVDQFRLDLGGNLNPNTLEPLPDGRREINWDDVPDDFAAPGLLPGNFFNVNSPGGIVLTTNGSGFQVSADSDNPSMTPVEFENLNAGYPTEFQPFSSERLFTPIGSNMMEVTFRLPGTNYLATVNGFGVVFSDVDAVNVTSMRFFDESGTLLLETFVPAADKGLSFVGVSFDAGERVARVEITAGDALPGVADSLGSDVVAMDDFIYGEPQPLILPVTVVNPRTVTYQDADGDLVTVKTTRGSFSADNFLVYATDAVPGGGQLVRLSLTDSAGHPFAKAKITFTAKPTLDGGNGFVNVGFIDATNMDLGTINIRGDLGRLQAGTNGSDSPTAVKSLIVQSIGQLGTSTQEFGGSLTTLISGSVGTVKIGSDLNKGQFLILGDAKAGLKSLTIGGSIIGGEAEGAGSVTTTGDIGAVKVAGDVIGGSDIYTGAITSEENIGKVVIGGSIVGGTSQYSGSVIAKGSIKSVAMGGSLRTMADGNGFLASGSIIAGEVLGAVTIKGSVSGTADNPALISGGGQEFSPKRGVDTAIKSVKIGGSISYGAIFAGYSASGTPFNADASIGAITVGGDWIATTVHAGTSPGPDGISGSFDDALISGMNVRNQAGLFSTIASLTIKGQTFGTDDPTDNFGVVAEEIKKVKIGSVKLPFVRGPRTPTDLFFPAPTGPGSGGDRVDFAIFEIGA